MFIVFYLLARCRLISPPSFLTITNLNGGRDGAQFYDTSRWKAGFVSNVTLENIAKLTLCLLAIVDGQTIRLVTANELNDSSGNTSECLNTRRVARRRKC